MRTDVPPGRARGAAWLRQDTDEPRHACRGVAWRAPGYADQTSAAYQCWLFQPNGDDHAYYCHADDLDFEEHNFMRPLLVMALTFLVGAGTGVAAAYATWHPYGTGSLTRAIVRKCGTQSQRYGDDRCTQIAADALDTWFADYYAGDLPGQRPLSDAMKRLRLWNPTGETGGR